MANLGKKGDSYVARFRLQGKEYKKSLKTRDEAAAKAAMHVIELTLHRILTGQLVIPERVDPGDFVVSGGTLTVPILPLPTEEPVISAPSTRELIEQYTTSLKSRWPLPTTPARFFV